MREYMTELTLEHVTKYVRVKTPSLKQKLSMELNTTFVTEI